MLTVNVGGKPVKFLVDKGTDVAVVTQLAAPLISRKTRDARDDWPNLYLFFL